MRTVVAYILAIASLAIGAAFAFPSWLGGSTARADDAPKRRSTPPPVVVAPVVRATFAETLEALGTVIANESVDLTPNRADHVSAIHFQDGQRVEAGELVVEMNAAEERAMLAEAIAVRDDRRINNKRSAELFEQKMVSERERDAARTALAAAEARVISIRAAIADREIRAPFDGILGLRRVSVGAYVQPSTIITTLDDLSVVKLDFTVAETWLASVSAGMTIEAISDAWPDATFRGAIVTVDTRLDEDSRSVTVRAKLPNPDAKLRPGMLLKVQVHRGEAPVLQIPEEAVIPVGNEAYVLRVDEGNVASRVPVEIGRRRPGAVEVTAGLEREDLVVIEGIVRVRPGQPVEVVATRTP